MSAAPTATNITVCQVLAEFDGPKEAIAQGVESGEFALWVGSGISRQAPNLGQLIERALDFLRERAIDPLTAARYRPALDEAIQLAELVPAALEPRFLTPLAAWPEHDAIINKLWNKYSRVLDIRVAGERPDFILWDAIDIRQAFSHPAAPAAAHLCIAILILEGAIDTIASGNWDGFIEAAVNRLTDNAAGTLQVIVDPNHLRGAPGRAQLLKFHGCILYATSEPNVFRDYLTGSHTQIMSWPETPLFAAMRNTVVGIATNRKALVLGLSIQDNNLQTIFTRAAQVHAWPWPCAPEAPGHVFCEDTIQQGQRDVLRLVYGDGYNLDPLAVHTATHLRAWGEQVVIALVLKLLADKLIRFMSLSLIEATKAPFLSSLSSPIISFRDEIGAHAVTDPATSNRTPSVRNGIALWSRALSVYRNGTLPASSDAYETLCTSPLPLIEGDQNARSMKLGRFAIALSLLERGRTSGLWTLSKPITTDLTSGALTVRANRPRSSDRPVFIVKSVTEAIGLKQAGAFANDNAIVLHGDDLWDQLADSGKSPRRVSTAPGRSGAMTETHVSLERLLVTAADTTNLQQLFESAVIV